LPYLEINELCARYGDVEVLRDVSLSLEQGEVLSLIGPSGSGKSTLLRVLVGLLAPSSGHVAFEGQRIRFDDKAMVRALRQSFAIVFQQYNLFQNMNVLRNVTIAPVKIRKRPQAECEAEARELLKKVGLEGKMKAYPDELSGGQQQRVALARALALRPRVLLLDEVTSALDPELVNEVLDSIRMLADDGMTMLIVSHEMGFVREVASRVAFMADGRVVETGSAQQIFDRPESARAREFVSKIIRS